MLKKLFFQKVRLNLTDQTASKDTVPEQDQLTPRGLRRTFKLEHDTLVEQAEKIIQKIKEHEAPDSLALKKALIHFENLNAQGYKFEEDDISVPENLITYEREKQKISFIEADLKRAIGQSHQFLLKLEEIAANTPSRSKLKK